MHVAGGSSDFGSWFVEESLEPSWPAAAGGEPRSPRREIPWRRAGETSLIRQRPASATVRVPYMPSHVTAEKIRPKPRPRSATPSYMRATYSKKSMIAAPADHTSLGSSALRLRPRSARSAQHPGEHSTDASAYAAAYVLDEVAYSSSGGSGGTGGEVGGDGSLGGAPVVPRPRQCFFVRTAAKKAAGTTVLGHRPRVRPSSAPVRSVTARLAISNLRVQRMRATPAGKHLSDSRNTGGRPPSAGHRRASKRTRGDLSHPNNSDGRKATSPTNPNPHSVAPASAQTHLLRNTVGTNANRAKHERGSPPVAGVTVVGAAKSGIGLVPTLAQRKPIDRTWFDGNDEMSAAGIRWRSRKADQGHLIRTTEERQPASKPHDALPERRIATEAPGTTEVAVAVAVAATTVSRKAKIITGSRTNRRNSSHGAKNGTSGWRERRKGDNSKWIGLLGTQNSKRAQRNVTNKDKTVEASEVQLSTMRRGGGSPRGLAINPSPWGAVLWEQSGDMSSGGGGNGGRKRPSSAREYRSHGRTPAGGNDAQRARPRSAQAATRVRVEAAGMDGTFARYGTPAQQYVQTFRRCSRGHEQLPLPQREKDNGAGDDAGSPDEELVFVTAGSGADRRPGTGFSECSRYSRPTQNKKFSIIGRDREGDKHKHGDIGLTYKMGMPVAPAFWPRVLGLEPKPTTQKVATPVVTAAVDAAPTAVASASKTRRGQSPTTAVTCAEAAAVRHQHQRQQRQESRLFSSSRYPVREGGQQSPSAAMTERQARGPPLSSPPPPSPPPPPLPLPSRRKIYSGHSNIPNSPSTRNNEDGNNISKFRNTLVSSLYGSALVPAGGRTPLPVGWNKKKSPPGSIVIGRAHTPPIVAPDTIARMQDLLLDRGKRKHHKDAAVATAALMKSSPFNVNGGGGVGTAAVAGTVTTGGSKRCMVGGGGWLLADEATTAIPRHVSVQTLGRSASIRITSNARGRGLRRRIY